MARQFEPDQFFVISQAHFRRAQRLACAWAMFVGLVATSWAEDFSRDAAFASVAAFVQAAEDFKPATSSGELAALFAIREGGDPDDPRAAEPVLAKAVEEATRLWSDGTQALIFVMAAPPTVSTKSEVGVLFLLSRKGQAWRIADLLRCTATGKYAGIKAPLTADVGTGYEFGQAGMPPVVTIVKSDGGRGYSRNISASYTTEELKLKLLPMN